MHAVLSDRAGGEQHGDIVYASTYVSLPSLLNPAVGPNRQKYGMQLMVVRNDMQQILKCSLNGTEMKKTALSGQIRILIPT